MRGLSPPTSCRPPKVMRRSESVRRQDFCVFKCVALENNERSPAPIATLYQPAQRLFVGRDWLVFSAMRLASHRDAITTPGICRRRARQYPLVTRSCVRVAQRGHVAGLAIGA